MNTEVGRWLSNSFQWRWRNRVYFLLSSVSGHILSAERFIYFWNRRLDGSRQCLPPCLAKLSSPSAIKAKPGPIICCCGSPLVKGTDLWSVFIVFFSEFASPAGSLTCECRVNEKPVSNCTTYSSNFLLLHQRGFSWLCTAFRIRMPSVPLECIRL